MGTKIKVLLLEDVATDAELELRELARAGFDCTSRCVETEQEFRDALFQFIPDVILSDYALEGDFDGMKALDISRELFPDTPFIFVSGTIGEERAIESLKRGASDYVLKNNTERLAPAVQRALMEKEMLLARLRAEQEIEKQRAFFLEVINVDKNLIFVKDRQGRFILVNQALADVFNTTADELLGKTDADIIPNPGLVTRFRRDDDEIINNRHEKFFPEQEIIDATGRKRYVQTTLSPIVNSSGGVDMILGVATDITERKRSQLHLATQNAVARVLSENTSFEQALQLILETVARNLDFQAGILWEVDELEETLRCEDIWVEDPHTMENFIATAYKLRIAAGESIAGRAWLSREPHWVADAGRSGAFSTMDDDIRSVFSTEGFHTVTAFPIVSSGTVKGIMSFCRKRIMESSPELLEMFSAIGSQIGQFLERKSQQENIQRLNRIYAVLSAINTIIVRVHDRDKLFQEACDIAIDRGRFLLAWIGFFDPDNGELNSINWGNHEKLQIIPVEMNAGLERGREKSIIKRVLAGGKPAVTNRLKPSSPIPLARETVHHGCLSAAAFPLRGGDANEGLLVLYSEEADFFDDEEMRLLHELASDISFALQYLDNEEKVSYLAYHDPLTGLLNRTALYERLCQAVADAENGNHTFALLLMNINSFRDINDTLGHHNGDALLKHVAQRLRSAVWDTDITACLGGDDFAVLLPHLANKAHIDLVINKIQQALRQPFSISDLPINVEATMGITLFPDHGDSAGQLWQRADVALRTAKQLHQVHKFYSQEIDHYSPQQLALIGDLRSAIDKNELTLHYQPVIDLRTSETVGVEVLVRWLHPQHGLIYPDNFIPFAERTGLINPLTTWVLANALHQVAAWHNEGMRLGLSVNLSVRNLQNPNLDAEILDLVRSSGFPLDYLTVEITESAIMVDPIRARNVLRKLHETGISFSLDDFGTGHSSLTYLKDLPVSKMKIDKSFVMNFNESRNAAIVHSSVELGHNLGLVVTAEGVEDESTFLAIRDYGCDFAQGYYFSKALPANDFIAWLRDSVWSCATNQFI